MTYATFHAPETSFGPQLISTVLKISTHFWHGSRRRDPWSSGLIRNDDVHDVHDLDRSGAGPISSPIHKKIIFFNFIFFEISKRQSGRAPGESKNALRMVGGAWGAGATEGHLEGNHYPVQLYGQI